MPVNKPNAEYDGMSQQWKRCSDVYNGQCAIHAAGELYLPKLKEQTTDDYNAYRMRAIFYNATYRTISGLMGMIFRKPPKVVLPPAVEELAKDITMTGTPLNIQLQDIVTEALKLGRIGLFVDHVQAPVGVVTQADAAKLNLRPKMVTYCAQSIINWRVSQVNNKSALSLVVLEEDEVLPVDEFSSKCEKRWRVLDIDSGVYRVRIFMRVDDKDVLLDTWFPTMNGKTLDFIPFQFIGTDDVTPDIDIPPLVDLVDLNISHYQSTADLEHGAHFTGLPTAWIAGYKPEKEGDKMYIGSSSAWVFADKDAKVGYLEFTGAGLESLEKRLAIKETQMAVVGARMLEPQKRAVETSETESIHRKGEESMLSSVSQSISLGVTTALKWLTEWAGADPSAVELELNRDFFPVGLTPQQIAALVSAWQQGAISDQTLFDNLQAGEIIDADTTFEEEQARIGEQAARFAQQTADAAALTAGAVNDATGGEGKPNVKKAA